MVVFKAPDLTYLHGKIQSRLALQESLFDLSKSGDSFVLVLIRRFRDLPKL